MINLFSTHFFWCECGRHTLFHSPTHPLHVCVIPCSQSVTIYSAVLAATERHAFLEMLVLHPVWCYWANRSQETNVMTVFSLQKDMCSVLINKRLVLNSTAVNNEATWVCCLSSLVPSYCAFQLRNNRKTRLLHLLLLASIAATEKYLKDSVAVHLVCPRYNILLAKEVLSVH